MNGAAAAAAPRFDIGANAAEHGRRMVQFVNENRAAAGGPPMGAVEAAGFEADQVARFLATHEALKRDALVWRRELLASVAADLQERKPAPRAKVSFKGEHFIAVWDWGVLNVHRRVEDHAGPLVATSKRGRPAELADTVPYPAP